MSAELVLLGAAAAAGYQASKEAIKITGEIVRAIVLPPAAEFGIRLRDDVKAFLEPKVDRAVETVVDATRQLESVGLSPRAVPGRVLFPLLNAASAEEEPDLRKMWSTLLANAGDPRDENRVLPAFVSILKDLSPVEARLLAALHKPAEEAMVDFDDTIRDRIRVYISGPPRFTDSTLLVGEDDFRVVADNLARLGLVETVFAGTNTMASITSRKRYDKFVLSPLGRRFVEACTRPPSATTLSADSQLP